MKVYSRSLELAAPAILIALLSFLLFRNKAFNIDDYAFLTMSDHMLEDPLHPASVAISLNGHEPVWQTTGMWSGPVMPAMLMPAVAAGGVEWIAHLTMLLVLILGIVATTALALRLDVSEAGARWAALLMTTSAAVLAMASTNVPDIPTMSFGVLGAERLVAFRKEGGWWRAVMATAAMALCVLSRQHGALVVAALVPIVFQAWPRTLAEWRTALLDRRFLACIVAMAAAAALVLLAHRVMSDERGQLASTTTRIANPSMWRANAGNIPAQWVLSLPLAFAWACLYRLKLLRHWWCYVGAALGVYLAFQTHVFTRRPDWLPWQAPITAFGAAMLVDIIVSAIRRRDMVEVGLTASLFIMVPVVFYTHLPPKYFVPAAPAMAILLLRNAERGALTSRVPFAVLCVFGTVLGMLIIRADATHAETGRKGGEVVAKYVAKGERVWYDGAWAFEYYAAKAGGRPAHTAADGSGKPRPGDIVVVGLEGYVIENWPNKQLLEKIEFKESGGRTLRRPAGFFSNVHWGPLPWVWSKRPYEPVEVYRIE
jgi:4-amino-4-deoxy-L-arabinose transferase-like glycosyltransferase